jgi:hypothetical protein
MQDKKHDTPLGALNELNAKVRKIYEQLCCANGSKEVQTYTATITSDTDVIAAVPGKKIKVTAYALFTSSTGGSTVVFKSNGTSGTSLFTIPLKSLADTYFGANLAGTVDSPIFQTNIGEKLTADVSSSESVIINLSYILD